MRSTTRVDAGAVAMIAAMIAAAIASSTTSVSSSPRPRLRPPARAGYGGATAASRGGPGRGRRGTTVAAVRGRWRVASSAGRGRSSRLVACVSAAVGVRWRAAGAIPLAPSLSARPISRALW